MGYSASVCLLLGLSALAHGLGSFFPNDKEVVFDYDAVIKAGTTILNKPHDSVFVLSGKLHIQSPKDDYLIAQLKDVSFGLYNGETSYGYEKSIKQLPIPEHAADLTKPFKVMYSKTGQVEAIATDKSEKVFARNMHRAIAGMLHVKKDSIDFNSEVAHGFVTDENSIYGTSHTVYNVLPRKKEVVVQKMHDMKSTNHMYHTVVSSLGSLQCDAPYEEPISHDSQQVYTFRKENGKMVPYKIQATGGFYFYPYIAKANVHYMHTTVTLNMISMNPVSTLLKVDNELIENRLLYNVIDPNHEEDIFDVFSMNHNLDYKTVLSKIEQMMKEAHEYYHMNNNFDIDTFDIKKSQILYEVIKLLTPLKLTDLAKLYSELSDKTTGSGIKNLKTFHQVLPLVGSHASIVLVSKIVRDKKVQNPVALNMLQTMSGYVQFPTEELLKDTEHMLNWGNDIDSNVQRAALLNFGILIKKTFIYEKLLYVRQDQQGDESEIVRRFLDKHPIYNNYINTFAAKMKAATDTSTQVLYAQVIYNTGVPSLLTHLLPIVTGKVPATHDLRVATMNGVFTVVMTDYDKIVEIFWPIFTDWEENTEIRIIAFWFIVATNPPASRFLNIFWEMQGEPNVEVYNFYYTFMQATSRSTDPCSQMIKVHATQLLKYSRKPMHFGRSHYFQHNFHNEEYNFGREISGGYMATDKVRALGVDVYTTEANYKVADFSLLLRISGLSGELDKIVELNLKEPENVINFQKWIDTIKSIPKIKGIEIDVVFSRSFEIVQSYHFDKNNMDDLFEMYKYIAKEQFLENEMPFDMFYGTATRMMMPTEIGIPAYMETLAPVIDHRHIHASKEVQNGVTIYHLDNMYHISRNERLGLRFFNPIANIQQGVVRKHAFDLVIPIRGDFSFNQQSLTIKASLRMHPEQDKNVIGLRSYTSNHVYAETYLEQGFLKKSCERCTDWHQITNGEYYRNNETVIYNKGTITGFATKVVIFDSETYGKTSSILSKRLGSSNKGLLSRSLTMYMHDLYLGALLPSPYTQGYVLTIYPTTELPVDQIDMTLRFAPKLTQKRNDFLPAMKFVPRLTYALKSKDKPLKTWDVSLNVELNSGHTTQNTKLEITRVIPDKKDYKFCVGSLKEWTKDGLTSQTHIGMGETTDGLCSNATTVDILMTGKMMDEQKSPYHLYGVCDLYSQHSDRYSVGCAAAHTSIRNYVYDVKMKHMPSEYLNVLSNFVFTTFRTYMPYYRFYSTHDPTVFEPNHFKIEEEYLTNDNEVNVKYTDKDYTQEFIGIPAHELSLVTSHPDNTHYSEFYTHLFNIGMVHACTVESDRLQHEFNEEAKVVALDIPDKWTYILGDATQEATNGVYVKKPKPSSKIMALKLVHDKHSLDISVTDQDNEAFKILVDGKEVSQESDNYHEDWFNYVVRSNIHSVVITNFKFKMHMIFDGRKLTIYSPVVNGVEYYGLCVPKK